MTFSEPVNTGLPNSFYWLTSPHHRLAPASCVAHNYTANVAVVPPPQPWTQRLRPAHCPQPSSVSREVIVLTSPEQVDASLSDLPFEELNNGFTMRD
jgi:hypothetical protein